MTDQALLLKCWSCEETFHIRLATSAQKSLNKVRKIIPCPFCAKGCSLTLREDEVATVTIQRGGDNADQPQARPDLPPGAFLGRVFATEPAPETEEKDHKNNSPSRGE